MNCTPAPGACLAHARWLWLAIDPISKVIPTLHLGRRRNVDAYTLLHQLKTRLAPDCVPIFLSDGFRAYFYAITAHFGHWFRPLRACKDHWQVDQKLLYGQLLKRKRNRRLVYTLPRVLLSERRQLVQSLKQLGLSGLIQTAFIDREPLELSPLNICIFGCQIAQVASILRHF